MSCFSISELDISGCSIDNKGADHELLVKYYPNKNTSGQLLEKLDLDSNQLTSLGMVTTFNEDDDKKWAIHISLVVAS